MSTLTVSSLEWPLEKFAKGTVAFDSSYPTGGETLRAIDFGLSRFSRLAAYPTGAASGGAGYVFDFTLSSDYTTASILVFRSPAVTPTGTIAVTDGAITVKGGGIGEAIGINPDSNSGVLAKAAATDRTIPQATFGIAATTATFTGQQVSAAALEQVSNGTNLSTLTAVPVMAWGF